jgi:two-component system sensor histidine kinase HydH
MVEADMRAQHLENPPSPEALKDLLDRVIQNLDIAYIGLLAKDGQWIAGAKFSDVPRFSPPEEEYGERGTAAFRRVRELPEGGSVYEVGQLLGMGNVEAIVVGLWMTPLEEAQKEDIRHAMMMGGILLVLGCAAFYFIFVVQNYYLVDRTLAEMKSYTENVVESMANGLIAVDRGGQIVATNRMANRILGFDTLQVSGRPLEDFIPRPILDIHDVLEHEKSVIERDIDCPVGQSIVPLNVSATPLRGPDGDHMGAVIILRDMREIRDLQERVRRSERLASLGRLASGVAHEIRNPLSSIKGFAQYFRDKFDRGSEDESYASIMIEEVDRLNRVITQLLDFARPKEPRIQSHPVSQILEHSLRLIQPDLERSGIKLTHSELPESRIEVDLDQMTQAFLNIFLNAIESMEQGGELRVETLQSSEKGEIEIRISDAGYGIGKEDLPRIFDPFFSTKKKGTGLGLAITAKIIEAHQGEISVESVSGKGTVFRIHLPLDPELDRNEENPNESEDSGGG